MFLDHITSVNISHARHPTPSPLQNGEYAENVTQIQPECIEDMVPLKIVGGPYRVSEE